MGGLRGQCGKTIGIQIDRQIDCHGASVFSTQWLWLPNLLSLSRLLLSCISVYAILATHWILAASVFVIAVVSDFADGILARRLHAESRMGKLLDHGADALFVVCSVGALSVLGIVPWLLAPLIAVAFTQYVVDSRVLKKQSLQSSPLGKVNGVGYFIVIGIAVFQQALSLDFPPQVLATWGGYGLIVTTIASIVDRIVSTVSSSSGR